MRSRLRLGGRQNAIQFRLLHPQTPFRELRGQAVPSFECTEIRPFRPLLDALAKRCGLTPCSALVPKLREQARSFLALRLSWLVEEVDETVHGLGMLNLVQEFVVDAAWVFEAVRTKSKAKGSNHYLVA